MISADLICGQKVPNERKKKKLMNAREREQISSLSNTQIFINNKNAFFSLRTVQRWNTVSSKKDEWCESNAEAKEFQ